jgi:thiamine-phosphate pyrophosphorylase
MRKFNYKLYLVTNTEACCGRDFFEVVEAAIKGGVDIVQIREKDLDEKDFLDKTLRLKELLYKYNVPLIVNDSLAVAMRSNASGLHVGNSDAPPTTVKDQWPDCSILGYSVEHLDQLKSDNAAVSNYIALSPIFATKTKTDTIVEWGLEGIRLVRSLTNKPLVAIGNVNATNAASIIAAGADCLAVVSAICSAQDPEWAAADIRNEIEKVNKSV